SELVTIQSSRPMELVSIDYLTLERSKGGFENILVITDHFTRYAQAFPTRNQTAHTTARVLYENFIVHYSFPAKLHSDQGRNFESHVIRELSSYAKKLRKRLDFAYKMAATEAKKNTSRYKKNYDLKVRDS
ncbi:hypothetical protein ScPMuIL_002235, partial [Solemya velum]